MRLVRIMTEPSIVGRRPDKTLVILLGSGLPRPGSGWTDDD